MAPTVQKRVLCARMPMKKAAEKENSITACCEPGPFSLKKGTPVGRDGLKISNSKRANMRSGIRRPGIV